jgi:uncharacterized protein (TIGR00369 family)
VEQEKPRPGAARVITEGEWAGWSTWSSGDDPYETAIGPFCFKAAADGAVRCAFAPDAHHLNNSGAIHGGALMSFADFSLFALAQSALNGAQAVTVTCNCEFLSPGSTGAPIEAEGEVLRATRSMIFVRGIVRQLDKPLLAFSGSLKIVNKP